MTASVAGIPRLDTSAYLNEQYDTNCSQQDLLNVQDQKDNLKSASAVQLDIPGYRDEIQVLKGQLKTSGSIGRNAKNLGVLTYEKTNPALDTYGS